MRPMNYFLTCVTEFRNKLQCICVLWVSIVSFYDFSIGFWKCPDSVAYFVGHFIIKVDTLVILRSHDLKL